MSRKIVAGEIGLAMVVWPDARTMTAPAICYRRPRCRVVEIRWPYVIVKPWPCRGARDDVPTYRVHADNLRRTDPAHRRRPARRTPPAAPTWWRQLHLF